MHRPRVGAALLPLAMLVGCGSATPAEDVATTASSITGGESDTSQDGVVALLIDDQLACTGSVIAPRVVLTAAHCLYGLAPESLPVLAWGQTPSADGSRVATTQQWLHPSFDPITHESDIALLLTAEPLPVSVMPLAHTLPPDALGDAVSIVGFGRTSAASKALVSRHDGTSIIDAVGATTITLHGDPSLPCNGDSGGPVRLVVDGVMSVAGVVSYGDDGCTSYAVATRVDAYASAFLDAFASQGGGLSGDRCFWDGNCNGGDCVSPPDAPLVAYCDGPCSQADDCPASMQCATTSAGSRCRYAEPSPGAVGTSCDGDVECNSAVCASPSASASSICTTPCFADDPQGCPSAYACLANPDVPGADACFPSLPPTMARPSGACSILPASRGEPRTGLLAALSIMMRWARRRRRDSCE